MRAGRAPRQPTDGSVVRPVAGIGARRPLLAGQPVAHLGQGPGAVTETVFLGLAQLGKGSVHAFGHKQRVVAEPVLAARSEVNPPFARTLEELARLLAGALGPDRNQRHRAAETRPTLFRRHPGQEPQQLGIVCRIARIARLPGVQRGKPGRMHAGPATQRVHLQAGIIGEHPHSSPRSRNARRSDRSHPGRQRPRLLAGVLGEGRASLGQCRRSG
jgi:hypothetical protein